MKKLILAVMTLFCATSLMAQEYLEGDIIYHTFSCYSKTMIESSSQYINGVDTVVVTIKGGRVHEYNRKTTIHTVYDNNERILMWCDNTKKGFNLPYVMVMPKLYPGLFETTETKTIAGKEGVLYKNVNNNMGQVEEQTLFISDCDVPISPNAICQLNVSNFGEGFENKIALKHVYSQYATGSLKVQLQMMGKELWSSVSAELIAIVPREVDDAEFSAPADYKVKYVDKIKPSPIFSSPTVRITMEATLAAMNKYYEKRGMKITMDDVIAAQALGSYMLELQKENKKYMKSHKLLEEKVYQEIVKYEVEDEWDF